MNIKTIALIVVAILVVALTGRTLNATTEPSFCGSCHIIEPFYHSWQLARHASVGVECVHCHFRPGILGRIQGEAYAALKLAQYAIGAYDQPTGARLVYNQNCLTCHQEVLSKGLTVPGGLIFYHEEHVDAAQAECRQCHTAIGHPGAVAAAIVTQPPHIDRQACLRCHDGQRAPDVFGTPISSGVVHPGEPKIDTGLWKQIHWRAAREPVSIGGRPTEIDTATCARCHGQPTEAPACQSCHRPAKTAYAAEVEPCLDCHRDTMTRELDLDGIPYVHQKHLLHTDATCQTCHVHITHQEICADCHNGDTAPAIFGRVVR